VIDKALEEVENASETGHDDATEASISWGLYYVPLRYNEFDNFFVMFDVQTFALDYVIWCSFMFFIICSRGLNKNKKFVLKIFKIKSQSIIS
jgi:hypothetical protein